MLWWTWHDLNVRPRPSQSRALIPLSYRSGISGGERAALTATSAVARSHHRNLAEAAGLEPAHAMRGDLANRCHTIRRRLHRLAEGEGVEPSRRIARPGFQDQLSATAHHLPNLAGTPGFEPRISGLESDGLPLAYAPRILGACGRTRTHEGQSSPPDFEGGRLCCSATHAKWNSDFKSHTQDFNSEIHLC